MKAIPVLLNILFAVAAFADVAPVATLAVHQRPVAGTAGGRPTMSPITPESMAPVILDLSITSHALAAPSAAGNTGVPVLDITAEEVRDGKRSAAPVTVRVGGVSGTGDRVVVSLNVAFPVSAAERDQQVEDYVQWIADNASATERETVASRRAMIVDALRSGFFQNAPGDYVVHVRIRDRRVAPQDIDVSTTVHVADRGSWLQYMRARSKPASPRPE